MDVNFKYGNSTQLESHQDLSEGDLIFVNDSLNNEDPSDLDKKLGKIMKGDVILGTTRADESFVTDKITVAGGPLASLASSVYPDGIPAGTSMEEILRKLLCVELYPSTPTLPTITLRGNSSMGVKEIGESVTLPKVTMSTNNGNFNSADDSWSQPAVDGVEFSNKVITPTVESGFDGASLSGGEEVASSTATIVLGENKVTYSGTADYTAPTNSPVTNLGNDTTKTSEGGEEGGATFEAGEATKEATTTATGVYPVFYNGGSTNNNADATTKVVKNASSFEVTFGIESAHYCKFAFPASHSITKVEVYNAAFNVWGEYSGGSSYEDVVKDINGVEYDYSMWVRNGANYNEGMKFRFTLNKLTSVE